MVCRGDGGSALMGFHECNFTIFHPCVSQVKWFLFGLLTQPSQPRFRATVLCFFLLSAWTVKWGKASHPYTYKQAEKEVWEKHSLEHAVFAYLLGSGHLTELMLFSFLSPEPAILDLLYLMIMLFKSSLDCKSIKHQIFYGTSMHSGQNAV